MEVSLWYVTFYQQKSSEYEKKPPDNLKGRDTLDFGFIFEKRLQTVTFNPAVFRAEILASIFDIFKTKTSHPQEDLLLSCDL